jgi:hypothetical protein
VTDFLNERFGCKVRLNPPLWQASTAYTVVDPNDAGWDPWLKPTVQWPAFSMHSRRDVGHDRAGLEHGDRRRDRDGTAQWTTVDAMTKTESYPYRSTTTVRRSYAAESTDRFTSITTWLSGDNKGVETEVKNTRSPIARSWR